MISLSLKGGSLFCAPLKSISAGSGTGAPCLITSSIGIRLLDSRIRDVMQNQQQSDHCAEPDEVLVTLAQAGNNQAFATLIERHHSSCSKLAYSILRDKQDAEDEVQNACWKAFEHLDQFQRDAKFSTWLTRIVVNQCLMRLRQTKRSRLVYIEDSVTEETRAALSEMKEHSVVGA